MFIIIGGDGKEYGPVSIEQIREWIGAGRANLDTRARRDGESEWKRLADFPEFAPVVVAPPPVSGAGAPPPPPTPVAAAPAPIQIDVKAYADDLIARAPKLDVFEVISEAFNLWTKNFWPLVGVTLVCLLLPSLVPLGGLFLSGIFMGGLYYFYLGKIRGEPREFGDCFAGFSRSTVQLLLAGPVILLLTFALCVPAYACFFAGIFAAAGAGAPIVLFVTIPLGLLLILPTLYFAVCWRHTYALVIEKNLGFWDAMGVCRRVISKQWWRVFAIGFIVGIIAMLGIIGLIIGIFLTIPLIFAAEAIIYERLFNPPPRG